MLWTNRQTDTDRLNNRFTPAVVIGMSNNNTQLHILRIISVACNIEYRCLRADTKGSDAPSLRSPLVVKERM